MGRNIVFSSLDRCCQATIEPDVALAVSWYLGLSLALLRVTMFDWSLSVLVLFGVLILKYHMEFFVPVLPCFNCLHPYLCSLWYTMCACNSLTLNVLCNGKLVLVLFSVVLEISYIILILPLASWNYSTRVLHRYLKAMRIIYSLWARIESYCHLGFWACLITINSRGKISRMTDCFSNRLFLDHMQHHIQRHHLEESLKYTNADVLFKIYGLGSDLVSVNLPYRLHVRWYPDAWRRIVNARTFCTTRWHCFHLLRSLTMWLGDILQNLDVFDALVQTAHLVCEVQARKVQQWGERTPLIFAWSLWTE